MEVYTGTMEVYRAFTLAWYRRNPSWPDGRQPVNGRKTTIGRNLSYDEAVALCMRYNDTHDPGLLSRRAVFERQS